MDSDEGQGTLVYQITVLKGRRDRGSKGYYIVYEYSIYLVLTYTIPETVLGTFTASAS